MKVPFSMLLLSSGTCLGSSLRRTHNNIRKKKNRSIGGSNKNDGWRTRALQEEVMCDSDNDTVDNAIIHTGREDLAAIAEQDPDNRYLAWVISNERSYKNSIFIPTTHDQCKGIGFHWAINSDDKTIRIAAAAKIDSSNGWIAIGLSETGGMRGADVVYFTSSNGGSLVDAHILDYLGFPVSDGDDGQDWSLDNYLLTDDGYLIFEATRALNTRDNFDRAFHDDSFAFVSNHKIIGAWGSSDYVGYHGQNRVHSSVQLFASSDSNDGLVDQPYENLMKVASLSAEGTSDLVMQNFAIPTRANMYYNLCFSYTELIEMGFFEDSMASYVIGYEFIIKPETRKYMHHIVVDARRNDCDSEDHATVFTWSPGEEYFYFPDNSGMKFGGPDGFKSLTVQYHINNPARDRGQVDNGTGIRLFHTSKPVKYEIGMLKLDIGDPHVSFARRPIGTGVTRYTYSCPSECSQESFTSDIIILKEGLHMHGTGKRIINEVVRDGTVVHKAHIDYFDFFQTSATAPQKKPFRMKQGDSFRTTCYYDANDETVFGSKSKDEMCQVFILYYPKQPIEFCGPKSHLEKQCYTTFDGKEDLHNIHEMGRMFGYSNKSNQH